VFTVLSAPSEKGTYLKFGGVHRCAIFSHYGKGGLSEMAHVFISPKTGDVSLRWDVDACVR
jgi:hypothetical protein